MIFTSAAVIFVPLFRLLRLGAVLAYLFAGVVIGPGGLELVSDPDVVLNYSKLGVVFLLFLIGLELDPSRLWRLRSTIFGLGFLQVLVTGSTFFALGAFFGLSLSVSFVAGFGLALSSTAFALQILEEHRQLKTTHGEGSFSILMFQDLAVVPLLASLALIAGQETSSFHMNQILKVLAIIAAFIVVGLYFIRHALRFIAESRSHEVFTAISLLIVVGSAILMESVGLSMEMGAFLAGVLLANSEYRHELESNLEPFKGLLLGLFFIAVGMSLDLEILKEKPHWIVGLTILFMSVKGFIIFLLARVFRFPYESSRNMAFTLPQGGEFAFLLFSTALGSGLIDSELSSILSASVTLSMAATPLVFALNQRWLRTFSEVSERPYDHIESEEAKVIIAGYGRFGQIVSRFLKSENVSHTILEHSAAQVEGARKFGVKIYYGDASRADILEAAGAQQAEIFVLAIDDPEKSMQTARVVRTTWPHLKVVARARNRQHAIELLELGVEIIHRETLMTSLEVAKEVLLLNGGKKEEINKRLAKFRENDERILKTQFELRHDEKKMLSFTIQANEELEQILKADREANQSS